VKALEHTSFPELAKRIIARYNEKEDAMLLGMLGQEYAVRHDGIFLHGQRAPESHAAVVLDYLSSSGSAFALMPWRAIADFPGKPVSAFRNKVELPLCNYTAEIIARANTLLPMIGAEAVPSFLGSELSIVARVLPKVFLHVEFFQESEDFPAEALVLFSNNANEFLSAPSLLILAEAFKDRLLSLLRIY
jgi:hypothetical protein